MPNEKNRFNCRYPDCDKPATRVLTYWVDPPDVASKDLKQDVFCDEHAEAEMLDLQKPGLFTQTGWDGTKMDCTVNELTNSPPRGRLPPRTDQNDSGGALKGSSNRCARGRGK